MIGPFEMGNPKNISGTWEIVYKLDVVLRWGITEYKQWFNGIVLGQAITHHHRTNTMDVAQCIHEKKCSE